MEHADALILFGITGDLSENKLIPALYELTVEGRLDIPVVGVARSGWTVGDLRDHVRRVLADRNPSVVEQICSRLRHVDGDYQDPSTFAELASTLEGIDRPVFFMAIPPSLFDTVATSLASVGLNKQGRLVVEKPFGRDLASAVELNEILHRHFREIAFIIFQISRCKITQRFKPGEIRLLR
ncbi:MAG: hypothetical protein P8P85_14155, partial [Acidimicrobiales bacterium]|nr:hypothetical protein [Acidimicrobiales bacterium]